MSGAPTPLTFQEINDAAQAIGFDSCQITTPDAIPQAPERLRRFLKDGMHGEMEWMAERSDQRGNPSLLWHEVKSIIMLGFNYGPKHDPLSILKQRDKASISVYAQNRDYHDLIKKKLKALARWLMHKNGGDVKVFIDTAPVMEKPLAEAAGLGWQGKHTNLVSRDFGSWLFLGAIFTTLELPINEPGSDHCGDCTRCLDVCPTDAFPQAYRLDARRCISYLTIEHKGPIPVAFRKSMGNRIYGCDDCLAVCPWNKFAQDAREAKLIARDDLRAPSLKELSALDDKDFRHFFSGSPIKRIGRDRFIRNVMIAIGNSSDKSLCGSILDRLADPSPIVRGAAIWAAGNLFNRDQLKMTANDALPTESNTSVRNEWRDVLSR